MIQKLKRKFILTNMLLVSAVLLVVFAALVASNYQQLTSQSAAALRMALHWSDEAPPPRFELDINRPEPEDGDMRGDGDRRFAMVAVFTATVDADGTVSTSRSGYNVTVSEELIEEAVAQALATGRNEGTLSKLDLRFMMEETESGKRLAFADRSWEWENLQTLVLSSLLVGAGALLIFFLVSLFLARLSLRPVERAWEQQRQFVADASHELKTPLTVILANSGIVLAHREDRVADQAKWVEYIREEAVRMKSLVEDMLFLAKSDAARTPIRCTPIDFGILVTGCLLPFEPVAFESGATLESTVTDGLTVSGDEGQLRRLVMILLDNACKYAGKGGTVSVTLAHAGDRLKLTVRNTGTPISAEHLPHLFERFYRVDSARARDAGGYGLGLAIAKSICDGHRAKITVTSTVDTGTVFTVLLPSARTTS